VIYRYLDCGDLHKGFARVKCKDCGHEYLPAFSFKRRHFCPSCHQKPLWELGVGLRKADKQFVFNAFISADFLQGAVFQDSPLVKTKTSIMSGFGVSWIFLTSDKTVSISK